MESIISIPQDAVGLAQAAAELFEEAYEAPQIEKNEELAEMTEDQEPLARGKEHRTLSPGYYMWLEHVAEHVDSTMQIGIVFGDGDLEAGELLALQILRRARAEFQRKHPPCRGCGKPLPYEWDRSCGDCQRATAAAERGRG